MAMSRMALVLADSTAHGFRDVGIYGSKQVYIVCCGGSLLLGRRGHERSAILQQLVCQWQFVQEQLGGCSLSSPVQMCAIPGRDSVAQEGYDELGALRDHFQIAEGQKTINSYGCEIDGWELYGKREGGKNYIFKVADQELGRSWSALRRMLCWRQRWRKGSCR